MFDRFPKPRFQGLASSAFGGKKRDRGNEVEVPAGAEDLNILRCGEIPLIAAEKGI